ncbi:choice-of-anchor G family protein [Brachybacterium alimentarium]|uniref:choice-of-anchor G family protein n=1 Tax=Brachybacterium alimentarium TaxID=47845 RepID=UPI003FD04136
MSSSASVESAPQRRIHPSRRAVVKGAAWAAPVAAFSVGAPALAFSPSCTDDALLDSQARARMLSGQIGGADLDVIAEVNGVHAQAFDPIADGADSISQDLKTNPLTVEALSAINLNLGGLSGALTTILDFATAQDAGVLNEYAYANENAQSANNPDAPEVGGAGAVGNDGTIALSVDDPNPPALGTINLYSILEQATGPGVAELVDLIAGLDLDIGAVAGRAHLDYVCDTSRGVTEETVDRDYLLAYLNLIIESNLVGDLVSTLNEVLPSLTISTDAVWDLLNGVPLLGPLLSALGKGALDVTATVDVSQLTVLPIPNAENAALQADLAAGTITIDVASLLGGAYTGAISPFLNELAPNTRLFIDAPLPTNAAASLVDTLVDDLLERLKDLVSVTVRAGGVGIGGTGLLIEGSLRDFLEGDATAVFRLLGIPVNLGALLNPLLGGIGDLVETTLDTLLNDSGVLQTALTGINGLLSVLFDVLSGVLALTVNAQNNASGSMPDYYEAITPERRYDVSALHLEVLGMLDLLNLAVARGSVGQNDFRA